MDGHGARHLARERALQLLYEAETKGEDPAVVLDALPMPPDEYTVRIVRGVAAHREELDALIGARAKGWTLERMPAIDRNVLRLGAWELLHADDVPDGVVLDEAVVLAKAYSTAESGRFVNGVLAALARDAG